MKNEIKLKRNQALVFSSESVFHAIFFLQQPRFVSADLVDGVCV